MLEEARTLFNPFSLSHFLNDRACSRILVAKKKRTNSEIDFSFDISSLSG